MKHNILTIKTVTTGRGQETMYCFLHQKITLSFSIRTFKQCHLLIWKAMSQTRFRNKNSGFKRKSKSYWKKKLQIQQNLPQQKIYSMKNCQIDNESFEILRTYQFDPLRTRHKTTNKYIPE